LVEIKTIYRTSYYSNQ